MIKNTAKEMIIKGERSIYLAIPTKETELNICELLEKKGFDGIVYIGDIGIDSKEKAWQEEAVESSDVIISWISKPQSEIPTFTRTVEFDKWVSTGKLLYGRPDDAPRLRYLDWLYNFDTSETPINNLDDLVEKAIQRVTTKERTPQRKRY